MSSAHAGLAARIEAEGLIHHGIELRFHGRGHRIAMSELTGGRTITIYGQNRVIEDLIAARRPYGGALLLRGLRCRSPRPGERPPHDRFRHEGRDETLECDVIAGCDGFHGVSRASIPDGS